MPRGSKTRREILRGMSGGTMGVVGLGGLAAGRSAGRPRRHVVGTASARARRATERAADSVHRVLDFGRIGSAVAGVFPDGRLDALRRRSDVRYVEVDGTMHAIGRDGHTQAPGGSPGPPGGGGDTSETLPWGIDRVDAEVAHANGETGNGADIAVIDTGIDDDHPDLQANVGAGKAYVNCRGKNCNYAWSDDNDHGTHCSGIADAVDNSRGVIGVSTAATLHAVKVLDNSGSGSFSDVAAGIEYTADQGWDVGSMSLGASSGSRTVRDACQYAEENGVLLVAAAGNSGPCTDCVGYPAAYSTVVAVSSTTRSDDLSEFSSTGPEVELAAPGSDIYSTVIGGYDTFSGTSMACPHVAGTGGQLMANGYSNTEARDRLRSTAEDIGLPENESGYGLLDTAAALGFDSADST
jgi:subtilisin